MRIGEVAERAGVNIETLRYYERRGLLPEPARTPTGHRRYDDETVRFVRAIKEAQGLGFTLAEIAEYLRAARARAGDASQALRVRLAAKIDEVDAKIASLRRVREDLARVVGCACETLDRCTCGAAYLARRGRDPQPPPGVALHVTNGESAGNTLRRTALGGAVLPWQDVLTEGPVPALPPVELRAVRAAFLSECGWGARRDIVHSLERRDDLVLRSLATRRDIVLWFEHDLYDQLQLFQILALIADADHDPGRVELINVGTFEGRPDFHGLGELEADELESLWPLRRRVTTPVTDAGRRAWEAVTAPDPTGVAELARDGVPELPFAQAALARLLEELPAVGTGLARSERQLLEPLLDGPRTPLELFLAHQAREEAPFDGDAWAWRRLTELGRGERALIRLANGEPVPGAPPLGDARTFAARPLALTDDGRDVLAGADRVELIGIDRWLGGTHLRPDALWRWDAAAGRAVRSS